MMDMESSLSTIEALVNNIKNEIFSKIDIYSFVSPSAYETAWFAIIPDHPQLRYRPMFENCLKWILRNQKKAGFWGESDDDGVPTIDTIPATLACMIALKTWNVGDEHIAKGLAFIHSNTVTALLSANYNHLPRWFTIVVPAMVELAQETGLELENLEEIMSSTICSKRQWILETEELVGKNNHPPLLSYLETLSSIYHIDQQDLGKHLSTDGSLFQSPSATALAFMTTGDEKCKNYLERLIERCPNGVPPVYPMDEELIKLCMVNQIQRLGLADHFHEEVEDILAQVYWNYKNQESHEPIDPSPKKLYKDSLAFRLLRMHGYSINSWSFCWFLGEEDLLIHIEQNHELFTTTMYTVYRATDLMFPEEPEVERARSFSRKVLEKTILLKNREDNLAMLPNNWKMIEHELRLPWIARLDHLDHRMWIEENKVSPLWIGKASFYRLSCVHNEKLMQLAVENYNFRQSVYRNELEELKRWCKKWGLMDLGFGREKTTYLYFAVAASILLPHDSIVRNIVAKSGIIITVADDFFDMKGSLNELRDLTQAVQRWDGKALTGPAKIIFEALDDLVSEMAAKHLQQQGTDITKSLRDIWQETFMSWLMEATWSKSGYIPTPEEYLQFGMTSIATHTIVLPASFFLSPSLPNYKLDAKQYETITKLLMVTARLLNDIQSYQKEQEDGKKNIVLLLMKEKTDIKESITHVKAMLAEQKKELLKHALIDGYSDLPKTCKLVHLSCLKVFQMFFNSTNGFDSETELVHDIQKAIYIPIENGIAKPLMQDNGGIEEQFNMLLSLPLSRKLKNCSTIKVQIDQSSKNWRNRRFVAQCFSRTVSRDGCMKVVFPPKLSLCFI